MQINMGAISQADLGALQGTPQSGQVAGFAGYAAGDTITAEVVGVKDSTVSMQLPNGAQIETQVPPGVSVNVGDTVNLTLIAKDAETNMAQLKMDSVNGQTVNLESTQLEAYLMDQGIPPSKTNEAAAQVLIRNQIVPTPRNVANLLDVAAALPETPTSAAVMMAANNIAPTQKNADILLNILQGPTLGADVDALETAVSKAGGLDAFASVLEGNVQQSAGETGRPLAEILTSAQGFGELAQQLAGTEPGPAGRTEAQSAIQQFVAGLDLPPAEEQAAINMLTEAFQHTSGEPVQTVSTGQTAPQQGTEAAAAGSEGGTAQAAGEEPVPAAVQTEAGSGGAQRADAPQQEMPAQIQENVPGGGPKAPSQAAAAPPAEETASAARQETQDGPRVADGEQQAPASQSAQTARQDAEVGLRQEASQILKTLNRFVAKLESQDAQTDGKTLQDSVRGQRELAALTKAGVARMFGQAAPQTQRADAMASQIRMGGQFDQFYYAQVPFQTLQQQGTAELYVFKRNPQKAEAEKTHVTVLIGLDTEHMGRLETVLRSAESTLSVEFRVASSRIQKYMESATGEFRAEMRESGFPLKEVTVSQIREKTTPMNAMKVMEPEKKVRLQGLDIEA